MRPAARLGVLAWSVLVATGALAASSAPAASVSTNWAGYVAVPSASVGSRFSSVSGSWKQPSANCSAGRETYSAVWVGLGGYNEDARSLEQIGTDSDCARSGGASYSSWYELLPAEPVNLTLEVHPGDEISASVTVKNHDVTLRIPRSEHRRTLHHHQARIEHRRLLGRVDRRGAVGLCEQRNLRDPTAHRLRRRRVLGRNRHRPLTHGADRRPRLVVLRNRTAAACLRRRRGPGRRACPAREDVDHRYALTDLGLRRGLLGELAGTVDPARTARRAHAPRLRRRAAVGRSPRQAAALRLFPAKGLAGAPTSRRKGSRKHPTLHPTWSEWPSFPAASPSRRRCARRRSAPSAIPPRGRPARGRAFR